jgi:uncharacterized protein YbjT (DUF2867 family)
MIVIAGGTGRMGRELAAGLVDRGLLVRILARDPARVPQGLRDRVEVARADVREPETLGAALAGADTVVSAITGFGGPGAAGARAIDGDGNVALIDAAEVAGCGHFVLFSVRSAAADAPVLLFREKHRAEQHLERAAVTGTVIRPTAYMETWIDIVARPLIATGRTRVFGRGDNPVNFVSASDVATMAELTVVEPALHGSVIDAVGPENLSMNELVEIVRRVTGVTGRVDHASRGAMRALSSLLRIARPVLADQVRAGLLMDTADMSVDPVDRLARFPTVPVTTLEDVVRRQLSPALARSTAPAPG